MKIKRIILSLFNLLKICFLVLLIMNIGFFCRGKEIQQPILEATTTSGTGATTTSTLGTTTTTSGTGTTINQSLYNLDYESWTDTTHPQKWGAFSGGVKAITINQDSTTKYSGNYSIRVEGSNVVDTQRVELLNTNYVSIDPNANYTIRVKILDNTTEIKARIYKDEYSSGMGFITTSNSSDYSVNQSGWQELSYTFKSNSTAAYLSLQVRIYIESGSGTGNINIDYYTLEKN